MCCLSWEDSERSIAAEDIHGDIILSRNGIEDGKIRRKKLQPLIAEKVARDSYHVI